MATTPRRHVWSCSCIPSSRVKHKQQDWRTECELLSSRAWSALTSGLAHQLPVFPWIHSKQLSPRTPAAQPCSTGLLRNCLNGAHLCCAHLPVATARPLTHAAAAALPMPARPAWVPSTVNTITHKAKTARFGWACRPAPRGHPWPCSRQQRLKELHTLPSLGCDSWWIFIHTLASQPEPCGQLQYNLSTV